MLYLVAILYYYHIRSIASLSCEVYFDSLLLYFAARIWSMIIIYTQFRSILSLSMLNRDFLQYNKILLVLHTNGKIETARIVVAVPMYYS